jgi:DNA/RNA endonuclease YhcR with UshA esterase domain
MKTILKILSVIVLIALTVFGCKKKDFYLQNEPELSVSEHSFNLEKEAETITIEVESTRKWVISVSSSELNSDWYAITPSSLKGENNGKITVSTITNHAGSRTLTLTISTSGGLRERVDIRQAGEFETIVGDGTEGNPFTVTQVLTNFGGTAKWVKGYIVGGVKETLTDNGNSIVSPNDVVLGGTTGIRTTAVLIADLPDETDYKKCLVVRLNETDVNPSDMRSAVQLVANPGNLGKMLTVVGNFVNYFSVPGVTGITGYKLSDGSDEVLSLSPSTLNMGVNGGSSPVTVRSNMAWTVTPDAANTWCTVDITSGNGNQTLNISVEANPMPSQRTAIITVKTNDDAVTRTLTVNQAGGSDPVEGNGTKENPYTVTQGISNQGSRDTSWVEGYIVGTVKDGVTTISSASDVFIGVSSGWNSQTNVLIANSPDETDYTKCIAVNLPSGRPLRTEVNLVTNSANYKKKLAVRGVLRTYFGISGLRDSYGYNVDFTLEGATPPPPPPPGDGDGSEANPYTVVQGISNQGSRDTSWVEGYIVGCVRDGVTTISSAANVYIGVSSGWNSQTNVLIANSPDETDYTKCIAVNLPSQRPLRTEVNLVTNPANYKKKIAVRGVMRTYFGIAGLRDSYGYSVDFKLDDGGVTLPPEDAILSETLLTQASFDKFTAVSVLGDQVWTFSSQYGAVMSGHVTADSRTYANEDWFISPALNLSGKSNVVLTFEHARGPAGSMSVPTSNYTLWISTDYTSGAPSAATWVQLTIPTHGTTAWNYVSSGNIAVPADKLTATTRFAFKYVCNDTESATWEIKNVIVK